MLTEQVLKHNHHIIYNSKQLFEYATRMQQNNKAAIKNKDHCMPRIIILTNACLPTIVNPIKY